MFKIRLKVWILICIIPLLKSIDSVDVSVADSVKYLEEYLRIQTAQPNPDYTSAAAWLKSYCDGVPKVKSIVHEIVEGKPVVVCTRIGSNPLLKSIMLNSHTDVVPCGNLENWRLDPFAAERENNGERIVARGIQDMKSVGIQHVEALRLLQDAELLRTVHVVFVPDEEIGGLLGMGEFVKSIEFEKMNVGVELDESIASEESHFLLCNAERRPFWLEIEVVQEPAHGATMPDTTASFTLLTVLEKVRRHQEKNREEVEAGRAQIGDVMGANIVKISCGDEHSASNIVPARAIAQLDIRVPPSMTAEQADAVIDSWLQCENSSTGEESLCPGVGKKFKIRIEDADVTSLDVSENPWAGILKDAYEEIGLEVRTMTFAASTDARFLRQLGIPAFGFSLMNGTEVLLHKYNEHLDIDVFLRGTKYMSEIVKSLANAPAISGEQRRDEL